MKQDQGIKATIILTALCVAFLPILAFGQTDQGSGLIPCTNDCDYNDLIQLINNIINYLILIAVPIAAGIFAWAGLLYITTGVSDQKSRAKSMIQKTFIGFVFMLSAWLIVSTILGALLQDEYTNAVPVERT